MTGYLTTGALVLALAAVAIAGVQSTRLSSAQASLATVQHRLTTVSAERDQAVRDRTRAVVVLTRERDRAVAAEQKAATLLEQIARDAGTARDGETAPVLRDTIDGLHRTAGRVDSLYLGRRPDVWRLVVTRDGKVVEIRTTKDEAACRDLAMAKAIELVGTPAGEGIRLRCEASRPGESA